MPSTYQADEREKQRVKPNTYRFANPAGNKSTWFAVFMALCITMSSCVYAKEAKKLPGDHDYPVANPAASHYFVLNGDVDPAMKIKMSARWIAKNPDCSVTINWLEGVHSPFYIDTPLKMTWSGNHYAALVYLDAILPGRCQYSFKSVVVSGVDSQNQILEMADWRHPAPNEKSYADPDVWADLVILSPSALPEKDRSGIRKLICTPSYGDPYHPHVLQCGAHLIRPGWAFGSNLWITPSTRHAEVDFHYQ